MRLYPGRSATALPPQETACTGVGEAPWAPGLLDCAYTYVLPTTEELPLRNFEAVRANTSSDEGQIPSGDLYSTADPAGKILVRKLTRPSATDLASKAAAIRAIRSSRRRALFLGSTVDLASTGHRTRSCQGQDASDVDFKILPLAAASVDSFRKPSSPRDTAMRLEVK